MKLRREAAEWIRSRGFTHFVTLAFNPNKASATGRDPTLLYGGLDRATSQLRRWDAQVNRRILGRRWQSKVDERMVAIAFPENPRTNVHWHLLTLPPVASEIIDPVSIMKAEWKKLERNGTVDVQPISDIEKLSRYVTKQLENPECWERFALLGPKLS